jgi:crotonobetainyl-CoA:carnitine CoA-transferase CaiB-like acyl-CoA transferase
MTNTARRGPLEDLTVIDCTMALAGPFGASLLADLGARVIKVEPHGVTATATFRRFSPTTPLPMRTTKPVPTLGPPSHRSTATSAAYVST